MPRTLSNYRIYRMSSIQFRDKVFQESHLQLSLEFMYRLENTRFEFSGTRNVAVAKYLWKRHVSPCLAARDSKVNALCV